MQFMNKEIPDELAFMMLEYLHNDPKDIIRIAGSSYDNMIITLRYLKNKNVTSIDDFIKKHFCPYRGCRKCMHGEYCHDHYQYYCDGCKQFNMKCSQFFHDQHICPNCTICFKCDCVRSPTDMYDENRCFDCRSEGIECVECLQYIKLRAHKVCNECKRKNNKQREIDRINKLYSCGNCHCNIDELAGLYVDYRFPRYNKYCKTCFTYMCTKWKQEMIGIYSYKSKDELIKLTVSTHSKTNHVCATCNININDIDGMYVDKERFPQHQKIL